jgi:signal-transduction protein with cAMP-binding, CBS, and nucleotidyltransferase domain
MFERRVPVAKNIGEIMRRKPVILQHDASVLDAAASMRDTGIGYALVMKGSCLSGLITEKDLVVRIMAEGKDPKSTRLEAVCSPVVAKLSPEHTVENAVALMRKKSLYRIPVVEEGTPVGIVSIGNVAGEMKGRSIPRYMSAVRSRFS